MPKLDYRIVLWRRAIYQFRCSTAVRGVFAKVGIDQFVIEHKVVGEDKDSKPDIIGWNRGSEGTENPIILELTTNTLSKNEQLNKYTKIDPKKLTPIGIQTDKSPIPILGTLSYLSAHDNYCQIVFGESLESHNVEAIKDETLRSSILSGKGMDLVHIPEIFFTIVPESHHGELRRGVVSSIIHAFRPGISRFTAMSLIEESLDFLSEHIEFAEKSNLVERLENEMKPLVDNYLKEYIVKDGNDYIITEKGQAVATSPKVREFIIGKIRNWVDVYQLEEYDSDRQLSGV